MKKLLACTALALGFLSALPQAALADPVWAQSTDLSGTFDDNWTYASDSASRTASVTYIAQTVKNTSNTAQHFGMYFGWNWVYGTDTSTALLWNNATGAFEGGGIKMTVARTDALTYSLLLGDVFGDTWINNPWNYYASDEKIATQAGWNVPLLDFGMIGANSTASYGVKFTLSFDSQAVFDDWDLNGSLYNGAEAVVVPEPAGIALVGIALLAAGAVSRRRKQAA